MEQMEQTMERRQNETDKTYLYRILCVVTAAVVLLPLTGSTEAVWRKLVMAVIQVATLGFSAAFFKQVLDKKGLEPAVMVGTVLYMTCPYRIYMCYDGKEIGAAAAWMLLPLYGMVMVKLNRERKLIGWNGLIACISLAGIGYADMRFLLITLGVTLAAAVFFRTILFCAAAAGGCVLFVPGWLRLGRYLLTDAFGELQLSVQSIMPKGYSLGQFFTSYTFREGHPGMGMGLMLCLVLGLWLGFVQGVRPKRATVFWICAAMLLLFGSTRYCPWDPVQRAGLPFLRLVGMLRTPAVFFGYACACLCVPAVSVLGSLEKQENKIISTGLPILVIAFGLGICLYQGFALNV